VNAPSLGRNVPLGRNIFLSARLARRSNAPLFFAKCERLKGVKYRVSSEKVDKTNGAAESVKLLDQKLEAAVRKRP
jgi:lauroyl/myristoyl acyltransferase